MAFFRLYPPQGDTVSSMSGVGITTKELLRLLLFPALEFLWLLLAAWARSVADTAAAAGAAKKVEGKEEDLLGRMEDEGFLVAVAVVLTVLSSWLFV